MHDNKLFILPKKRLTSIDISYIDFNGFSQKGNIICLDVASSQIIKIFDLLYEKKFPIFSVKPVDHFDNDDFLSMNANNSSAYNHRMNFRTKQLSSHAYGLAIDINPIQNPYLTWQNSGVSMVRIYPDCGKSFINRNILHPAMLEPVVNIFKQNGFTIWGGNWSDKRIDYHHFQAPDYIATLCTAYEGMDAAEIWNLFLVQREVFKTISELSKNELSEIIRKYSFLEIKKEYFQ